MRKSIRLKLDSHSAKERRAKSLAIGKKLFRLSAFQTAKTVCFYVSLPEEVDTAFMIDRALRSGKRVAAPLSDLKKRELALYEMKNRTELVTGAYGILEPPPLRERSVKASEIDCVVVPGLVFDKKGNRLGRGKGFYDRFLKGLDRRVPRIGLAFSFQVAEKMPVEAHDEKVDVVLTEREG
ncbi:MAG: 5-formyltetrahydrofolate cyclo-ligase [Candidatus Omnitrophica bacterium]|nr:5-formyltetrahydrofolate cyclo-ligase [Candidatus Omnitrophota bacterium]